jgi:hypothetical protein
MLLLLGHLKKKSFSFSKLGEGRLFFNFGVEYTELGKDVERYSTSIMTDRGAEGRSKLNFVRTRLVLLSAARGP